jgi:hypothetical protein
MSDYGFCLNPEMVRIDLFKENGKWYTTLELKWDRYFTVKSDTELIEDTFKRCINEQYPNYKNYYVVCLNPYHEYSHPLMTRI